VPLALLDFIVSNEGATITQDDQFQLNHDGDTVVLGLTTKDYGAFKRLVYHLKVRERPTGPLNLLDWTTTLNEDRALTEGTVEITNSEHGGVIGIDRNTTVTFVEAETVVTANEPSKVIAATGDRAKADAGDRDARIDHALDSAGEWFAENAWWAVPTALIALVVLAIAFRPKPSISPELLMMLMGAQ